jgi:hypothetical protein
VCETVLGDALSAAIAVTASTLVLTWRQPERWSGPKGNLRSTPPSRVRA